jgi:hypothetical protein
LLIAIIKSLFLGARFGDEGISEASMSSIGSLTGAAPFHPSSLKGWIANGVKAFVNKIPAEFLAFGTDPLERLQAVMVAYRMKKQGKHWSVNGADNLIQLLSREWNGEELERILDEGIEGLSEWEALCSPHVPEDGEEAASSTLQKKKPRRDFSPLPISCVPLLQRGRTDSYYTPLKRIGELKLVPHIVEFREEGCQAS